MSRRDLLVGDAERDLAADTLAEHYAQGRLLHEQYVDRLDVVWRARTRGDLRQALAGLPRVAVQMRQLGGESTGWHWSRVPTVPLLLAGLVLSVVTGQHWWVVAVVWSLATLTHRTTRRVQRLVSTWSPATAAFPSAYTGPSRPRQSGPR